jgi:sulfate transport system ATP-binding protein
VSIEVQNITKTFGGFLALDHVNLTIPNGELVALLGPSGSGKTTLLRIIAGLDYFDPNPESAIRFHDQDVTGQAVGRRQVGFVFQHYALFRHLTVFENIAFGLQVRRGKDRLPKGLIREKVQSLLALIQLEGLERRYPAQLSGGQRQRVALARALAIERIQAAGPTVKIELTSETEETVHVEMAHERFEHEALVAGSHVFLTPKESRLFVADYCI